VGETPYDWSKKRIENMYGYVKDWTDDGPGTLKHDVWSIKKLLALDYYIGPFTRILANKGFKKWTYVDPFSGSGLIKLLEKYNFPGSPLIPLFRSKEAPFYEYYLTDNNDKYVKLLSGRVEKIRVGREINVQVKKCDFSETVEEIFVGQQPNHWKDNGYLVFLDPYGLQVDWEHMARILRSGPVDVIFTFMTWAIVWNRNNKVAESKLTSYFGDERWKQLETQEQFVQHYCKKIQEFGYMNRYQTFTLDVIQKGGKRYDLILATQSKGGANVLQALQQRVKAVTTDLLRSAFSVAVGREVDLMSFFGPSKNSENK
jgi:three-Cys-motif partner protein